MAETLSIALELRLDEFRAAFKQVPEISAQEARDMVTGIRKELRALNAAAEESAAKMTKVATAGKKAAAESAVAAGGFAKFSAAAKGLNANPVISQLESMGALFIGIGGDVSRVAMTFTTAVRPVSTLGVLFGELTVATQAATIGLGSVAAGAAAGAGLLMAYRSHLQGVVEDGIEAADKLDAFKSRATLPQETISVLERYKYTLGLLADEELRRTAEESARVAEESAGINQIFRANGIEVASLSEALGGLYFAWLDQVPILGSVIGLYGQVKDGIREVGKEALAGPSLAAVGLGNLYKGLQFTGEAAKDLAEQIRKAVQAAADAAETRAAENRREAEAIREQDAAYRLLASTAEKHLRRYVEGVKKTIAEESALREYEMGVWNAWNAAREQREENVHQILQTVAEDYQRAIALEKQLQSERNTGLVQYTQAAAGAMSAFSDLISTGTAETIESYERRREAGERTTDEEYVAYKRALHDRRVASVTEIVTQAAVAYAGMVAQMAPYAGPAAPALAATTVGLGLIAPLAALLGESIPWGVTGESGPQPDYSGEWVPQSVFGALGGGNGGGRGGAREGDGTAARSGQSAASVTVRLDRRTSRLRVVQDPPGKAGWRGGA